MAACAGVDLFTVSHINNIPYGTLARWASEERWPIIRPRNRRLKLRQLYDYDKVEEAVAARQKREAEARSVAA
jgi:hypothetical protein